MEKIHWIIFGLKPNLVSIRLLKFVFWTRITFKAKPQHPWAVDRVTIRKGNQGKQFEYCDTNLVQIIIIIIIIIRQL